MGITKTIVIFTEGETDEMYFKILLRNWKTHPNNKILVKNLKGIGRYDLKAPAKLKHEVVCKFPNTNIIVFCSYDLDVFSVPCQIKPPVDWKKVDKKLKEFGADKVFHIKADKMIEDWFLSDLYNICKFLKIEKPNKIAGKNGYEKLKFLFKKGNKIYQKGYNTNNFISYLDTDVIYSANKTQFKELKKQIETN